MLPGCVGKCKIHVEVAASILYSVIYECCYIEDFTSTFSIECITTIHSYCKSTKFRVLDLHEKNCLVKIIFVE